jgi:hypothetical protein
LPTMGLWPVTASSKLCGHAGILAPLDSKLPIESKCQKIPAQLLQTNANW